MRSIVLVTALLLAGVGSADPPTTPAPAPSSAPTPGEPLGDPDAQALARLKALIAGREKEPAEAVFKNIQIHQGKPAAAVLGIMKVAYAGALGVHCSHCHDTEDWASDKKSQKEIARQMSRMMREINAKHLASIKGLESEKPAVNCTTCHRGDLEPALELPRP
jgi:hypothetical protein